MVKELKLRQFIGAVMLSLLLSISLFYLTLELPRVLDPMLHNYYPDLFFDFEAAREMIEILRPYALLALVAVALLIAIGFLLAMTLASKVAKQEREDPDRIVDLAFYVLLAGLVGSRIVFIFTKLDEYIRNPVEILMFWRGGLVWYGGFIGAALFAYYYCRRYRLNYFKLFDIAMPMLALGCWRHHASICFSSVVASLHPCLVMGALPPGAHGKTWYLSRA